MSGSNEGESSLWASEAPPLPWSDTNSDPVGDMRRLMRRMEENTGRAPHTMVVSDKLWKEPVPYVVESRKRGWKLWRRREWSGQWVRLGGRDPFFEHATERRTLRGWGKDRTLRRLRALLDLERPADRPLP